MVASAVVLVKHSRGLLRPSWSPMAASLVEEEVVMEDKMEEEEEKALHMTLTLLGTKGCPERGAGALADALGQLPGPGPAVR